MKKHIITVALFCFITGIQSASAVLVTTSGSGAGGDATITFENDVTFAITSGGSGQLAFLIDEAVTYDGTPDWDWGASGSLQFQINEGPLISMDRWRDNGDVSATGASVNDSYFGEFGSFSWPTSGDTVTLKAGSLTIGSANANFNLLPSGNYDMFIIDGGYRKSSDLGIEVIPEPATLGLVGLFAGGIFALRRIFMI